MFKAEYNTGLTLFIGKGRTIGDAIADIIIQNNNRLSDSRYKLDLGAQWKIYKEVQVQTQWEEVI